MKKVLKFAVVMSMILVLLSGNIAVIATEIPQVEAEETQANDAEKAKKEEGQTANEKEAGEPEEKSTDVLEGEAEEENGAEEPEEPNSAETPEKANEPEKNGEPEGETASSPIRTMGLPAGEPATLEDAENGINETSLDAEGGEESDIGKLSISMDLRFPSKNEDFEVSITDGTKTLYPTSKPKDDERIYFNFENSNLTVGKYTLTIDAKGYKKFTQKNIEIKKNTKTELKFSNGYDISNLEIVKEGYIGIIGIGDVAKDGTIGENDELEMIKKIQSGSTDKNYDLNGDGKVNIIDLSYVSINSGDFKQEYYGAMPSYVAIVEVDEKDFKVDAEIKTQNGTLQDLMKDNDKYVTLGPKDGQEISKEHPVELSFDIKENAPETEVITIAPSANIENNIESGEAVVIGEYQENGQTKTKEITIPIGNVKSGSIEKLYKVADLQNGVQSDSSNTKIDKKETGTATISSNGTINIDLGGKVAVKKVTIKITGTKSKKLADIAKVEFLNEMDKKIPEPELNEPRNVVAKQISEDKITISWENMVNVTGYQVRIRAKVEGKDIEEYHSTQSTMITLEQIGGKGIKDLTKTVVTIDVCSVNGEWKSPFSSEVTVKLETYSKPPKPEYVVTTGGVKEIKVQWRENTKSSSYDVYYRLYETGKYIHANKNQKIEGTATEYTITGLATESYRYQIYVTATNDYGTSEPSAVSVAQTKIVEPVIFPKYKMINIPAVDENGQEKKGVLTQHITKAYSCSNDPFMIDSSLDNEKLSALGTVDNNFASFWQKNDWDDGGSYYYPKFTGRGVTVEFDNTYEMNYFALAQVENLGTISKANISYWDENNTQHVVAPSAVITKRDENGRDYVIIKLGEKIKTNKVNIGIGRTGGYTRKLTIAEIKFYYYDSIGDEITGLYADQMHTTLKKEVTQEKINELRNRLEQKDDVSGEFHPEKEELLEELELAELILKNGANLKPAVKIDTNVTTKKDDGKVSFLSGLNAWQPLGIVAYSKENIKIYVGNPNKKNGDDANLQLITAQYYPEASTWKSDAIPLKIGMNEITVPEVNGFTLDVETGGSLYINYTGNNSNEIYGVRVDGGDKIPMLDFVRDKEGNYYETEADKKQAVHDYLVDLEARITNLETLHNQKHDGNTALELNHQYNKQTCLLGATEIVLNQMMYSVCGEQILEGLKDCKDIDAKTDQLYQSLIAMDEMIDLFYSHKGMSKDPNAGDKNKYPVSRLNIRYHRMFAGAAMYAGGLHIGIPWEDVPTLSQGEPIKKDKDGKYISGKYFGWGISHEIGHIINESAYVHGEVTNNYYSVLSQAKDTNDSVRFDYKEVYKKVTSGTKGKSQNVFTQLGLYWQLHLAFDKGGYNYKMFDTYDEQKANLIVARMDSYARDVSKAPKAEKGGIDLKICDSKDDNLMRLACAATESNILTFFEKWGMEPNDDTIKYAQQWPENKKAIWYINDEARAYELAGKPEMSEGTEVKVSLECENNSNKVKLSLDTTNQNNGALLGYEIIRGYWKNNKFVSEPVAFVTTEKGEKITYTDTVETINNRVFTYKVVAYDKYLNATKEAVLEPIKISHDGQIGGKENWEIETNLKTEEEKENTSAKAPRDNLCNEPKEKEPIDVLLDNNNEKDYVANIPQGQTGEITIALSDVKKLVGLKYTGKAIKKYEVQVSTNGTDWKTVCSGENGETLNNTLYFNSQGDNSLYMYDYDASYVKLIIKDENVSLTKIDLLGQTGDNITFLENKENIPEKELPSIGILSEDFTYAEGKSIPKDSIVFIGDYKGNPAYNIVKLWYQNSVLDKELEETDGYDIVGGQQIILAPDPESKDLGNTAKGTWIYWVEPTEDGKENPIYKQLQEDLGKGKIRAELYRVDDAYNLTNERLVSDTLPDELPSKLPSISLSGVKIY